MRLLHQVSPSEGGWNEQRVFRLSGAPLSSAHTSLGHQHLGSCRPSSYTCPLPSSHSVTSQLSPFLSPSCCHRHVDTCASDSSRHLPTPRQSWKTRGGIFRIVCVDAEQLKQRSLMLHHHDGRSIKAHVYSRGQVPRISVEISLLVISLVIY